MLFYLRLGAGCVLACGAGCFLLSKCFFLAPWRVGWWMTMANALYETAAQRLRLPRAVMDPLLLVFLWGLAWAAGGARLAALLAVVLALAWSFTLATDLRWRSGVLSRQYQPTRGRVPLSIPQLVVSLRGPVLKRTGGQYDLGDWPEGLAQDFQLIVLNASVVRPQLPLRVECRAVGGTLALSGVPAETLACPEPEAFVELPFTVRAMQAGAGGVVQVRVTHGDFVFQRTLRVRTVVPREKARVVEAAIRKWKYGASASFVWRGDHDLYDPCTFQSAEGLRMALGLSRRFRLPSTVMLSGRLSLLEEEHKRFCERFGWNRRSEEIPSFVEFLKTEVDCRVEMDWPFTSPRSLVAEIGNHMFLHYGTHAAADAGNDWKSHARLGAGHYPWLSGPSGDSFVEQRDNLRKNAQVVRDLLGLEMSSFTIPGDVYDGQTARAAEAAGIEIGSETNASKFTKVFLLKPPHHPEGCERLVELTRKYPKDPTDACQVAMLKYWMGAARRTGRALVFLAHHHLLRHEGVACYQLTEELFRHVLADCDGDVYVATLTAVGRYWRDVLSERTRTVRLTCEGNRVTVENSGARDLEGLPVEIRFAGGGSLMRLVNLPARSSTTIEI